MSVHVIVRTGGETCQVSNGGVPCEAVTCTLRQSLQVSLVVSTNGSKRRTKVLDRMLIPTS